MIVFLSLGWGRLGTWQAEASPDGERVVLTLSAPPFCLAFQLEQGWLGLGVEA
jgi:hypothetical protein